MEVDTEEHRLHASLCSYDHVIWCVQVGLDVLGRKISQLTTPWRNDIAKMDDLLVWKMGNFMRPTYRQASNGLKANQCFWDWDTKGVMLPEGLEDPDRLADLVQSKKNREFTIDQWVETHKRRDEYMIWPEEYLSHPGMDEKLFRTLFGRELNREIVGAISGLI